MPWALLRGPYKPFINKPPTCEGYMTRLVVRSAHQNDMHYHEIGLHAQNVDIILVGSIHNVTVTIVKGSIR